MSFGESITKTVNINITGPKCHNAHFRLAKNINTFDFYVSCVERKKERKDNETHCQWLFHTLETHFCLCETFSVVRLPIRRWCPVFSDKIKQVSGQEKPGGGLTSREQVRSAAS